MVEDVVELGAELDVHVLVGLADVGVLHQREIEIVQVWAEQ